MTKRAKKKREYNEAELDRMHSGKSFRKGMRAEARRELHEHKQGLLALLIVFIMGLIFGAVLSRNRD